MKKITINTFSNDDLVVDNVRKVFITKNLLIWETCENRILIKHSVILNDVKQFVIVEDNRDFYGVDIKFMNGMGVDLYCGYKLVGDCRHLKVSSLDDFNNEYNEQFGIVDIRQVVF